jgi:predicted nucleic acid-binding protein
MSMIPIGFATRTNLLDASALVKLVVDEVRSEKLRRYLRREGNWYTTPFCFYEALGALKVKHFYKCELCEDQYHKANFALMAEYRAAPKVHDLDLTDPSLFTFVQGLATKHAVDISDAFQLASILRGCPFTGASETVLVSDDKKLARAARVENCKVWHLCDDPPA